MKSSNRVKLFQLFVIFLFTILLLLPSLAKFKLNFITKIKFELTQEPFPEILAFSNDRRLSVDDSIYPHHVEVSMAISEEGTIFVGWKNSETHNGGGARVSVVRSVDGGQTWTNPYDMPMFEGRTTRQSDPWLYWYNGTIYYAYLEYENQYFNNPEGGYLTQITVAKSDNDGETWTPINATAGNYFADKETFIVGENNTVYVVYDDADISPTGNATVRLTRSLDGGDTYQEISNLGENFYFVGPYITLNSTGDIFMAWTWAPESGGNLYFTKSIDKGLTFDPPILINQDGNYCIFESAGGFASKATLPVLEFDHNDRLYVLWADKYDHLADTWDVYLRYSDDYGLSWSNRIRINPSTTGNQWNPDMAIDESGRLHIVYYSEQEGRYKPYYRTLNFTGPYRNETIFSEEIAVAQRFTSSEFTRPGEYFAIQIDNNNIPHIAWSDARNNEMDIFYSYGLTYIPFPVEIIIIIVIIAILGIVSLVVIFYIRRKHRMPFETKPKISDKKVDKREKDYMKAFKYVCSNCHKFTHTLRNFCENCGTKDSLKLATKEDFHKYMPDLR
ncbi:MAG: sialidase family protein [Promethearchaeota archaeon]